MPSSRSPVYAQQAAPGDWILYAKCRSPQAEHADLFDPIEVNGRLRASRASRETNRIAAAKQFCHRCPVRPQCRAYAVCNGLVGVWGGTYFSMKRLERTTP